MKRPHAEIIEQNPHPLFGPAPFAVVVFDRNPSQMDRRRVKRETNKALRAYRNLKRAQAIDTRNSERKTNV